MLRLLTSDCVDHRHRWRVAFKIMSSFHAVILAAGVSQRMGNDENHPKCLLQIGGRTLLARHGAALAACGVTQMTLVTGYFGERGGAVAETVAQQHSLSLNLVENPQYEQGSLVSLAAATNVLRSGQVLLMDADVLYPVALLRRLLESPHTDCFILDTASGVDEEEMRLGADESGRVRAIVRGLSAERYVTVGEGVGFLKLSARAANDLADIVAARIEAGEVDDDYEMAINDLLKTHPAGFVPVEPYLWIEIDFPEDLDRAREEVWPGVQSEDLLTDSASIPKATNLG